LSGGAAYYNGGYGVGFNLLKRSDNGRTTMHAGVGWGSGAVARWCVLAQASRLVVIDIQCNECTQPVFTGCVQA
jgi:hypothetical protein